MAAMVECYKKTALLEDITLYKRIWTYHIGEELTIVLAFLFRYRVYTNVKTRG